MLLSSCYSKLLPCELSLKCTFLFNGVIDIMVFQLIMLVRYFEHIVVVLTCLLVPSILHQFWKGGRLIFIKVLKCCPSMHYSSRDWFRFSSGHQGRSFELAFQPGWGCIDFVQIHLSSSSALHSHYQSVHSIWIKPWMFS